MSKIFTYIKVTNIARRINAFIVGINCHHLLVKCPEKIDDLIKNTLHEKEKGIVSLLTPPSSSTFFFYTSAVYENGSQEEVEGEYGTKGNAPLAKCKLYEVTGSSVKVYPLTSASVFTGSTLPERMIRLPKANKLMLINEQFFWQRSVDKCLRSFSTLEKTEPIEAFETPYNHLSENNPFPLNFVIKSPHPINLTFGERMQLHGKLMNENLGDKGSVTHKKTKLQFEQLHTIVGSKYTLREFRCSLRNRNISLNPIG